MSSPTIWSAGRYDAVGERIAHIAGQVVDAVAQRRSLTDQALVDLACGTGSAAAAAAARGARVTGVDVTPELIALAARRAAQVTWLVGDAADTGLPSDAFDAAVSNMGIVFVEPERQLAEITRILKPAGILAFSAWVRGQSNPLFDPVLAVLGPPGSTGFSPDQWGDADVVTARLAPQFDDIEIRTGEHRWEFDSLAAAMHFLRAESPMHVATFERAGAKQAELATAFEDALRAHADPSGRVAFSSPYVVVSAVYRAA